MTSFRKRREFAETLCVLQITVLAMAAITAIVYVAYTV